MKYLLRQRLWLWPSYRNSCCSRSIAINLRNSSSSNNNKQTRPKEFLCCKTELIVVELWKQHLKTCLHTAIRPQNVWEQSTCIINFLLAGNIKYVARAELKLKGAKKKRENRQVIFNWNKTLVLTFQPLCQILFLSVSFRTFYVVGLSHSF